MKVLLELVPDIGGGRTELPNQYDDDHLGRLLPRRSANCFRVGVASLSPHAGPR